MALAINLSDGGQRESHVQTRPFPSLALEKQQIERYWKSIVSSKHLEWAPGANPSCQDYRVLPSAFTPEAVHLCRTRLDCRLTPEISGKHHQGALLSTFDIFHPIALHQERSRIMPSPTPLPQEVYMEWQHMTARISTQKHGMPQLQLWTALCWKNLLPRVDTCCNLGAQGPGSTHPGIAKGEQSYRRDEISRDGWLFWACCLFGCNQSSNIFKQTWGILGGGGK